MSLAHLGAGMQCHYFLGRFLPASCTTFSVQVFDLFHLTVKDYGPNNLASTNQIAQRPGFVLQSLLV